MKKNLVPTLLRFAQLLMLAFGLMGSVPALAQDSDTTIYVFEIRQEIAAPAWHRTQKAFKEASELGADIILIHMNTYGGMLDAADSIRTAVLQSPVPVWVFVDNNAASAGALIAIACDSIYMRTGASMGAATVVNQTGEKMPDKYQSYMRSMMRSTAEATGRDPDIAEAMVDPGHSIPGVTDSGRVVSLTASEAIRLGFCQGTAENLADVIRIGGVTNYRMIRQEISGMDKVISFFLHPAISALLVMIIIAGIYFEFQSPGAVFPIAAAALAALLYFAPLYLEGLAAHWEILIFVLGVILLAVEIFAIPGFGVAGISGIVFIVAGLTLSLINNLGFDFSYSGTEGVLKAFFLVIIPLFLTIILSIYISKKVFTTRIFGGLALNDIQEASEGFTTADRRYKDLVGREGVAATILRPGGKVEIDEDIWDAVVESGYVDKGEKVRVVGYEKTQLIVRKIS